MLNKEECQKACLYLLKHCYETDAPALENGEEGKTYTFTPSGFKESEIFKQLIEEHFYPNPLLPKDLKIGMYVWDDEYKEIGYVAFLNAQTDSVFIEYIMHEPVEEFQDDRFYPIIIPKKRGAINMKYRMSKFEYDLIELIYDDNPTCYFNESLILIEMKNKGCYQNIPYDDEIELNEIIDGYEDDNVVEFNDLKEGLFVWDRAFEEIIQITSINREDKWISAITFGGDSIETMFQKNRFIFVNIPVPSED